MKIVARAMLVLSLLAAAGLAGCAGQGAKPAGPATPVAPGLAAQPVAPALTPGQVFGEADLASAPAAAAQPRQAPVAQPASPSGGATQFASPPASAGGRGTGAPILPGASGQAQAESVTVPVAGGRKVIKVADVEVRVPTLKEALERLSRVVQEAGGYIAGSNLVGREGEPRSVQMVIKVPPERFDGLMLMLWDLGQVRRQQETMQDLTEDYHNASARLQARRESEQALLDRLMAAQTENERSRVQAELRQVRSELEQLTAALNNIARKVEWSTLNLALVEAAPAARLDARATGARILAGLQTSWDWAMGAVGYVLIALAYVVPLGLVLAGVAGVGYWGARQVRRWRDQGRPGPGAEPGT